MKIYNVIVNGKLYEVSVEEKCNLKANNETTPEVRSIIEKNISSSANTSKNITKKTEKKDIQSVIAPIPGKIISIKVSIGEIIKVDQELIIMEAMKMHNPILSPGDGVVKEILVKCGDAVQTGNILVVLG